MYPALVSIGRDADMLVCDQRGNWRAFFGSIYELGIVTGFLSISPQVSPQGQEERQGPKGSVDLNQYVCLDDTGQLLYLLNHHDVVVHFTLLLYLASWCREGSRRDVRSRVKIYVKICEAQSTQLPRLITTCPS